MESNRGRMTSPQLFGVTLGVAVVLLIGILAGARGCHSGPVWVDTVYVADTPVVQPADTVAKTERRRRAVRSERPQRPAVVRDYRGERVDRYR